MSLGSVFRVGLQPSSLHISTSSGKRRRAEEVSVGPEWTSQYRFCLSAIFFASSVSLGPVGAATMTLLYLLDSWTARFTMFVFPPWAFTMRNLLTPCWARLSMVSMRIERRVSSLKVIVPLKPMWWGEYPGQHGWTQTLLVLLATSWMRALTYRESIPSGRWGPCCSMEPIPIITTGSGSFSSQSSKSGLVSS